MNAWATLLTQPSYLPGVRTLRASLEGSGSAYPLVVIATSDIDGPSRRLLEREGCALYDAEPLRPADDRPELYANARFAEVWTKLAAWRLTGYDRVVFADADMLVTQNMDELFTLPLPDGGIAACHACRCNPNRIASYPASWTPENCYYTHLERGEDPATPAGYFNAGLLVLTPEESVFAEMARELGAMADLSRYPFAEQDYLNERYRGRWQALPYGYNALKTLPHQHPSIWAAEAVKNIHYIIDKPWQRLPDPADPYFAVNRLWWDVAIAAGTVEARRD